MDNIKIGIKRVNTKKMNRSPDERHKKEHKET